MTGPVLKGYDLFDLCVANASSPVCVDFAGVSIPIVAARFEDGEILLEVGPIWEWHLEQREDDTDKKPPQPDPGTP